MRQLAPDAIIGQQPFFLAWGLHRPHLPFLYPDRLDTLYGDQGLLPRNPYIPFQMPDNAWSNWGELRKFKDIENLGNDHLGEINVTLPDWKMRELRRAYYSSVTYIDEEIGRVLDELDLLGLAESTIVVFLGDHGWQLGEHAEWSKHTNFEITNRTPLMIHMPG